MHARVVRGESHQGKSSLEALARQEKSHNVTLAGKRYVIAHFAPPLSRSLPVKSGDLAGSREARYRVAASPVFVKMHIRPNFPKSF